MKEKKSRDNEKRKGLKEYIAKAIVMYSFLLSLIFITTFTDMIRIELSNEKIIALFASFFGLSVLLFEVYRNITSSKTEKLFRDKIENSKYFVTFSGKIFFVCALFFAGLSISSFLFFIFRLLSPSIASFVFLIFLPFILLFIVFDILILVF